MPKNLTPKDLKIISHLRENARNTLTNISDKTQIPITTVYDKIKSYERDFIKKYTCLLNFEKLGFGTRIKFAIKVLNGQRKELQDFLVSHPNINSVYRVDPNYDFLVETFFRNAIEAYDFIDVLNLRFSIQDWLMFNIINEVTSERFMTDETRENTPIV